jgi:hypothetical protein
VKEFAIGEQAALALRELGSTIDLHGGGADLIFPHHECERAQSEAATGEPFVRHWMHVGMVYKDGEKMSKSLGNLVFAAGTGNLLHRLPALHPGESLVVRLSVRFSVQPGRYTFTVGTSELGRVHDWHEMLGPIEVFQEGLGPPPFYGLAELPMEARHGPVERLEDPRVEPALSRPAADQNWK